jgi:hypothetical protein
MNGLNFKELEKYGVTQNGKWVGNCHGHSCGKYRRNGGDCDSCPIDIFAGENKITGTCYTGVTQNV